MKILVKVSIIVPVYNSSKFLEKTINNILEQSLRDIEIVCVDCGSNDESKKILEVLSGKYTNIKLFFQENITLGNARNYAMNNSQGEYVFFIYPGDFFADKNALEILYDVANKNNADMVSGNIKHISSNNENILDKCYYFDKYFKIKSERYGNPILFYKNIYKKSFLDENKIFFEDSNNHQDPVFLSKILIKLNTIYGAPIEICSQNSDVYGKLDSSIKKLHYLTHFKKTFDILEKNNSNNISEKFKLELMDYLDYSQKINDLEVYNLVLDVFGKSPTYFENNFKNQFNQFLSYHMIHKISFENNEDFFQNSKKDVVALNLLNNDLLSNDLLRNLVLVFNSDSYEEYLLKFHNFKINNIKNENENLISKRDLLKNSVNRLNSINRTLNRVKDVNVKNIDLKNLNNTLTDNNEKLMQNNSKLSDDYEKVIAENKLLNDEINKLDYSIHDLTEKNQSLSNQNNILASDKNKLDEEVHILAGDNQRLMNQNMSLKENNVKLKNEIHELQVNNKNLEHNISEINREKEMLTSSKSWKITAPLRSMKKNIK